MFPVKVLSGNALVPDTVIRVKEHTCKLTGEKKITTVSKRWLRTLHPDTAIAVCEKLGVPECRVVNVKR